MKQDFRPDIIQRIQNGDTPAFRDIVETYQHRLFVWVARFLGPAAASDTEDIVQEIFLSAYTHIRSFDTAKAGFNLSPKHRSVFILSEFLGFTHEDISCIEKIPIGTVKSRLARTRKQLRRTLNQYWEQYKEPA